MRQTKPTIEDCKATEDMHHLRLMSVLKELVREEGVMEATRVLGISYRTLTSSMKAGRLSKKTRWALERLQHGEGSAVAEHWERNAKLKDRLDKLEEELHSGFKELRTALHGQRKEHDRHRRRVERQLAALVLGHAVTAPETPGTDENGTEESGVDGTSSGPPWWRPGTATQRKVTDLIQEWWLARNSLLAVEERLSIAMDWGMVADLAVPDESAEAFGEPRTHRGLQGSKRRPGRSQ